VIQKRIKQFNKSHIGVSEQVLKELCVSLGRAAALVAAVPHRVQLGRGGLEISVAESDDQPTVGAAPLGAESAYTYNCVGEISVCRW
jgi:hypothetical protein